MSHILESPRFTRSTALEADTPLLGPLPPPTRKPRKPTAPTLPHLDAYATHDVMASKIIAAFTGPITSTALKAWLDQCEDGFAIHTATKAATAPALEVVTMIRLAGSNLSEPSMAAWWHANRTDFLALATWEAFAQKIRDRFLPKAYKLVALRTFFLCAQGSSPFLDYAAALADARNAVGPTVISANIYKYHLLFHAHPVLVLRIVAIPEFDIDTIGFDDLVALMSMQWESIAAEGLNLGRLAISPRVSPLPQAVSTRLPALDDAERDRLSAAKGCWKCRKTPEDPGWVQHVGRTCPGDAAKGILPGRDYVPEIKREVAGGVFFAKMDYGEDQPNFEDDIVPADDDTDDGFY